MTEVGFNRYWGTIGNYRCLADCGQCRMSGKRARSMYCAPDEAAVRQPRTACGPRATKETAAKLVAKAGSVVTRRGGLGWVTWLQLL